MQIGVIADTHGHLTAGALNALRGVELILHAGDIGRAEIISQLEQIAPVLAVHGNSDAGTPLTRHHPATREVEREGVRSIYLTHIGGRPAELVRTLSAKPASRPQVYIFGHSHVSLCERLDGVLFLNPGAAGRPRFGGGLSVAILTVSDGRAEATLIPLLVGS